MYPSPLFFPQDLITEVLSKFWDTLISDPIFVKLHLKRSAKRNPQIILITGHAKHIRGESPYGSDDESEHECGVIPYSISSLVDNPSFNLSVDSYQLVEDKGCSRMVGSCNGLICLAGDYLIREYKDHWLRLWNSATITTSPKFGCVREFRNPPDIFACDRYYKYTFGWDESTDTYKVVASEFNEPEMRSNVRILSLADNVWRKIESFPVEPMGSDLSMDSDYVGMYLKSTINWLAIRDKLWYIGDDYKNINVEQFVIVSLDLRTETYNQYFLPRDFDEVPPATPIVSVLGDCLCFSYCYKETNFVIWKMENFGVDDSWIQFLKISYYSLQIDYDYSNEYIKYSFNFVPRFLSKDGDTLCRGNSELREQQLRQCQGRKNSDENGLS
ncbi:F-box/kelch-repeat protein At3g23880-like [Vicia villosa]|uniref:F-box/kelch-repeat protein At3g23880-like n=1 Tax=Vicia villosa TaxID=3911 RepID=UPI00273B2844|nr:F-box/kelch-repeat protein At3g23880-like [Vicia villosa]